MSTAAKRKKRKAVTKPPKRERHPSGVCRVCGCTDQDGCWEGCYWADDSHTLCSACVGVVTGLTDDLLAGLHEIECRCDPDDETLTFQAHGVFIRRIGLIARKLLQKANQLAEGKAQEGQS